MAAGDGKGSAKSRQRNANSKIAGRLAHLRNARFETEGFKSNAIVPSVPVARRMHGENLRNMSKVTPTPSVRQ